MTDTQEKKSQPIERVRRGNVRAAIWRNTSHEGHSFYSTTFEVSYKDDNGTWQSKDSYSQTELLFLKRVADTAEAKIEKLRSEDRASNRIDDEFADVA